MSQYKELTEFWMERYRIPRPDDADERMQVMYDVLCDKLIPLGVDLRFLCIGDPHHEPTDGCCIKIFYASVEVTDIAMNALTHWLWEYGDTTKIPKPTPKSYNTISGTDEEIAQKVIGVVKQYLKDAEDRREVIKKVEDALIVE